MFLNKGDYVIYHFNAHFLLCFLLMTYYLLIIFILDYRKQMLESKFEWFFFEFKIGSRAAETTCNINNTFGQDLLINVQCSGGSRSFAEKTGALKMRSIVASHQKLTATNWEPSSKLILFQLHEKLPKNSMLTVLQLFSIWSKLERWKISGYIMSWP